MAALALIMCQRAGLLIGWDYDARRALVTRANCDSWTCAECAKRMKERWLLRAAIGTREFLAEGLIVDFVTITGHEKLVNFAQTEYVWRSAWSTLYAALKRHADVFQYMIIPEKHADGRMHVHALWTAGVSKRWLKDNARRRGLGYQQDVQHVYNPQSAVSYVTKYIGKDLGADVPKRFKRVRVSQAWAEIPAPVTDTQRLKWEYIGGNGALDMVYAECKEKRIALIDLATGETFDDVDLGTISAFA